MRLGLAVAGVALARVDYELDTITLDAQAAHLFDLPADTAIPRSEFHARIAQDDWPDVAQEVEKLLDPTRDDVIDVSHRTIAADGSIRWVRVRKHVTWDRKAATPVPVSGVAAIVDMTAEKAAEERSRLLVEEMHHRTRNVFALVGGMARMLARTGPLDDYPQRLQERIDALAQGANLMRPDADSLDLGACLAQWIEPFTVHRKDRFSASGPRCELNAKALQTMSMIVHELATNALKYGAWTKAFGRVDVTWELVDSGSAFQFRWVETKGPPAVEPERSGFGSTVLTKFVELSFGGKGRRRFLPTGLIYEFTAPADQLLNSEVGAA